MLGGGHGQGDVPLRVAVHGQQPQRHRLIGPDGGVVGLGQVGQDDSPRPGLHREGGQLRPRLVGQMAVVPQDALL